MEEINKYFENEILPLKDKFKNYKLVVTGCIGSGKTTIINILNELFNKNKFSTLIIPEYLGIDKEFGEILLNKFIDGEISNLLMQLGILDIYETKLKEIKNENVNVKIFERIPDDNLSVFANISYFNNPEDITNLGINLIYEKTIKLNKKYNLPSYIIRKTPFKKIMATDLMDIIMIILQTIKNDIDKNICERIIGLSISLEVCKLRIAKRSRDGESKYSEKYLNTIIKTYNNIYKELEKDNYKLNLINFGKFVE